MGPTRVACSLRAAEPMTKPSRKKSTVRGVLVAGALVIPLVSACSAQREATVVARKTVAIQERTLPAPTTIDITIVDLHDEAASDPTQEKVIGTIVNDGDKRVSGLSIKVNALDGSGNVVRSVTTPPLAETIDAGGGRATFEAYMPVDPTVVGYHAIAIAR